jgi:hypothetical protein
MSLRTWIVVLSVACTVPALAQDQNAPQTGKEKTPVVNQRQRNQRARIRQGVKSGELTKGEAKRLRQEQKTIRAEKQMAKSDGKVTPQERAKLRRDQNKASRDIYRLKHNNRTQANQPPK